MGVKDFKIFVAVYGIYAFCQSLISIVLIFVGAFGAVIYPLIKRLDGKRLPEYYHKIGLLIKSLLYLFFLGYPVVYLLVKYYMPEYYAGTVYLPFLLMMCLPMSKIHMLVIPYCKAWRQEKRVLHANLVGLVGMVVGTMAIYRIFGTILSVAAASGIIMFLWYGFLEWYCFRFAEYPPKREWLAEMAVSLVYAAAYVCLSPVMAFLVFGIVFAGFVVYRWRELKGLPVIVK